MCPGLGIALQNRFFYPRILFSSVVFLDVFRVEASRKVFGRFVLVDVTKGYERNAKCLGLST